MGRPGHLPRLPACRLGLLQACPLIIGALFACTSDTEAPPELGVRVEWQTGDRGALPEDVTTIVLRLRLPGQEPAETTLTVGGLERDAMGRRFTNAALLRNFPAGVPVRLEVRGIAGMTPAYVGHVGPLRFQPGERRYVSLRMYPIGRAAVLDLGDLGGRFRHTATPLPDGRVLVAGGFTEAQPIPCPGTLALPEGSSCFRGGASRDAFLFDPTTGLFWEVQGGMLNPRGGHTATAFDDGRVLIAGGVESATLALAPSGTTFEPLWIPDTTGERTPPRTFELFLPDTPSEDIDREANGDPGRGSFVGAANPDDPSPGSLNDPRFLHAAARLPETDQVLLVGGVGSPLNWEVYDDVKPGGYGVYDNGGAVLNTARELPSAIATDGSVFILGGARSPANNAELAELWTPEGGQNGSVTALSAGSSFPNQSVGDMTPRPQYALLRPALGTVGSGSDRLVVAAGWLGPRCTADMETFGGVDLCGVRSSAPRSFAVDQLGSTQPLSLDAVRSFAAAVRLTSGSLLITGGFADDVYTPTQLIDVFRGGATGGLPDPAPDLQLVSGRGFHTAVPLANNGALILGGLTFSPGLDSATLVTTAEVFYLP